MSESLGVVRSIYADWERGDFSRADWADPEIEFVFAGGPSPGASNGISRMGEVMRDFVAAWEGFGSELFHVRGDKVARLVIYWDRERAFADLGLNE
jgi:hypothetical protein